MTADPYQADAGPSEVVPAEQEGGAPRLRAPGAKRDPRQAQLEFEERPFERTMRVAHEVAKSGLGEIILPRELALLEHSPDQSPSLAARRTIVLLIMASAGNAWADTTHQLPKAELCGGHKGHERLPALLEEIRGIVYVIPTTSTRQRVGRSYETLFDSLVEETDGHGDEWIEWRWSAAAREAFAGSKIFARVSRERLLALESKYSVTLYLVACLLIGCRSPRWQARVDELRRALGVERDSYPTWTKLDRLVLNPARQELAVVANIDVTIQPARRGRRVTHVELNFTPLDIAIRQFDGEAPAERAARRRYLKNRRAEEAGEFAQRLERLTATLTAAIEDDLRTDLDDELPF